MSRLRHDVHSTGFYVSPEQLAHDLAIVKLNHLNCCKNNHDYYNKYIDLVDEFTCLIQDKIKYDSTCRIHPLDIDTEFDSSVSKN
ncbi:hypothetical protein PBV87_08025 [Niameybacter massiliensis]|uniref:Uncharacterized protein n=1 Tax=Holtiella tumoricola TaxID=3018743 RepID=A0AA42DLQ4_9FIRM|nr:hypothetical protein [Holtiella tumoricola]MDA3731422.1 hypothetical protein [Holtiella tumoricola]